MIRVKIGVKAQLGNWTTRLFSAANSSGGIL